jgi:predicted  nucleic acid-binding Zn-ribbon protein
MDLKVLEPINSPLQEFKTIDEFNLFYQKNKEVMDGTTTHKLNRMYKIEGYKITKIKKVLSLKKWNGKSYYQKQITPNEQACSERLTNLEDCYDSMNEQLSDLDEHANQAEARLVTIEKKLYKPTADERVTEIQKQIEQIKTALSQIIKGLKENNLFT